jgi:hypothetical protein
VKAEHAKLPGAGIWPEAVPKKMRGRKRRLPKTTGQRQIGGQCGAISHIKAIGGLGFPIKKFRHYSSDFASKSQGNWCARRVESRVPIHPGQA